MAIKVVEPSSGQTIRDAQKARKKSARRASRVSRANRKRARQRGQKMSARNAMANALANGSLKRADKADFYRTLRLVKVRRHKIADRARLIETALAGLSRDVMRAVHRVPGADPNAAFLALCGLADAATAARETAEGLHKFARARVHYAPGQAGGRR
jgi:hypothetical protein